MKAQACTTCVTILLACTLSMSVSGQTKADIALEGPWIVHVDTSTQNWPVLVVISPGGVSDDNDVAYFHTISIDNGDGYPALSPGVYCLTFNGSCTPAPACNSSHNCPTSITGDGYPQVAPPLLVNVTGSWDWSHKWLPSKYAIAFVLPLPDYYSSDSGWYMRFSDNFDVTGQNYKNNMGRYATGLRLHYDNGPSTFGLQNCSTPQGVKLDLNQCTSLPNTDFDNVGTLHLTMRAPDNNNACDPHVRRAYPQMIGLLDGDNTKLKVIDLAHAIEKDGKTPDFDVPIGDGSQVGTKGYRCLEHDYQGGGTPLARAHAHAKQSNQKAASSPSQWLEGLSSLDAFIVKYNASPDNNKDPRLGDPKLLLNEIDEAYKRLDTSFPRFSQVAWIQTLLKLSMQEIDALLDAKRVGGAQNLELTLPQLKADEKRLLADTPPTKTGNDCKAPLMLTK